MSARASAALGFQLPSELAAHEPPEARGLARDEVRLLVSHPEGDVTHTRFHRLADILEAGDLLVVNASATINAAFDGVREASHGATSDVVLHLSAPLAAGRWVVELRRRTRPGTAPLLDARAGERVRLAASGTATLVAPYGRLGALPDGGTRLWIAELELPEETLAYATRHGSPIRYAHVPQRWPLDYYQTVFATEPGSVEMPSAGRPFTHALLGRLVAKGVVVAPLVLHATVSSLDGGEPPSPERYRVPGETARAVNDAHARGGRVVAVGTTVVRALETVAAPDGRVRAGHGWTDLVVAPDRGLYAVDALLTGLHEPNASHLALLDSLAGGEPLVRAYEEALRQRYLWHEFGDTHLILPQDARSTW